MSEVREFFRICPSCGKRFHIRLVNRKVVGLRKETEEVMQAFPAPGGGMRSAVGFPLEPLIVEENVPVTIDIEEFNYSYHCKHCGHEWSETHTEEHRERM